MTRLRAFFAEREATTSIDLVRTLLGLVLFVDFASMLAYGVPEAIYESHGLFAPPAEPRWVASIASVASPRDVIVVGAVAAALSSLRVVPRLAALVLLLVSAWLGFALPPADRGVDVLTRWATLFLALAPTGAPLVHVRATCMERRGLAWPRRFLVFQLALVYTTAGLTKLAGPWSYDGGYRAVELALHNTAYVRDATSFLLSAPWLLRAATFATIVFERTAFLLLATPSFVAGTTSLGGPRIARALDRFRVAWIVTGVAFHLSLAYVFALGSFPFVCLALYPALLRPDENRERTGARHAVVATPATRRGDCERRAVNDAFRACDKP